MVENSGLCPSTRHSIAPSSSARRRVSQATLAPPSSDSEALSTRNSKAPILHQPPPIGCFSAILSSKAPNGLGISVPILPPNGIVEYHSLCSWAIRVETGQEVRAEIMLRA